MKAACSRVLASAHAVAENSQPESLGSAARLHAAACPECAHVMAGARHVLNELQRAAQKPSTAPPEDLVHRIMARLPEPSARQRLWLAIGGSAAAASAATVFMAVLIRALPSGGGNGLLPGLRGGVAAAGAWLGRFAALFEVSGGLPLPGGEPLALSAGASLLPPLLLIALGLMGITAVLTLTATRPARAVTTRPLGNN